MSGDRMVGDLIVCSSDVDREERKEAELFTVEGQEANKMDVQQREPKKPVPITDFFYPEAKGHKKQNVTITSFFNARAEEDFKQPQNNKMVNKGKSKNISQNKTLGLFEEDFKQDQFCNNTQNKELPQRKNKNMSSVNEENSESIESNCVGTDAKAAENKPTTVEQAESKKSKKESQGKNDLQNVKCGSKPIKDILSDAEMKPRLPKWSLSWKPLTKSCKSTKKKSSKDSNSSDSDFEIKDIKQMKKRRKKKRQETQLDSSNSFYLSESSINSEPIETFQKDGVKVDLTEGIKRDTQFEQETNECKVLEKHELAGKVDKVKKCFIEATEFESLSENTNILPKTVQQEMISSPSVFEVLMKRTEVKYSCSKDQSLIASCEDGVKELQTLEIQTDDSKKCKPKEFKLSIRLATKKPKDSKRRKKVKSCQDNLDKEMTVDEVEKVIVESSFNEVEKLTDGKNPNEKDRRRKGNKKKRNSDIERDRKTSTLILDNRQRMDKNLKEEEEERGKKKRADVVTQGRKKGVVVMSKERPDRLLKNSDSDFEVSNQQSVTSVDEDKNRESETRRKKGDNKTRNKKATKKRNAGDEVLAKPSCGSPGKNNEEEHRVEIRFIDEVSLQTNSAPVSKSLRSKEIMGECEQDIAQLNSGKEPAKLAPIFTAPKEELRPKCLPKDSRNITCDVNSSNYTSTDSMKLIYKDVVNIDDANKMFSALFTGARSSKSVALANTVVHQTPAPWPIFNHIDQRGKFTMEGSAIDNSKSKRIHLSELVNGEESFTLSKLQFVDKHILGVFPHWKKTDFNSKIKITKEEEKLPEDTTKNLVTHLGKVHYPGIKIKRLFKRYKTKHHSQLIGEPHKNEKMICNADGGLMSSQEPDEFKRKTKRKLSCDHSQNRNKIPRTDFDPKASEEALIIKDHAHHDSKAARKRCKNEKVKHEQTGEVDLQSPTRRSKRLSGRLQKEQLSAADLNLEKAGLNNDRSVRKRKRQNTIDNSFDSSKEDLSHCNNEEPEKCISVAKEGRDECSSNIMLMDDRSNKSDGSKKQTDHTRVPWTERYQPSCAAEIMANATSVAKLKSWLEEWKVKREKTLRKELEQQKRLLAKNKSKASSCKPVAQNVEWWDQESDSDFDIDDASDDSDCDEDQGLCNTMLITGARGVGKTATVYALARELGYKVFEVNSSSKRSGKHILSQLEEATQSHQVTGGKSATTSIFHGAMKSPTKNAAKIPSTSPLATFLKPVVKPQEEKKEKKSKKKLGKLKPNVKEKKNESVVPCRSIPVEAPTESNSGLSIKAASLILFEEVDVVFEEDKGFWAAVGSFMQNAKCPIIMTSDVRHLGCDGRYEHISIKPPSVLLLAAHLQLICLLNNIFISPHELKAFVTAANCDIRKCLLTLQFWVESGGGVRHLYRINDGKAVRPSQRKGIEIDEKVIIGEKNAASVLKGEYSESHAVDDGSYQVKEDLTVMNTVTACNPVVDEESMFLSVDEFKHITEKGTKENLAVTSSYCTSSFPLTEKASIPSDVVDGSDSQSVDVKDGMALDTQFSLSEHHLLMESTAGILNCHQGTLEDTVTFFKERTFSEKCYVANVCQTMGVNLVFSNLAQMMPLLFTNSVIPSSTATKQLGVPSHNHHGDKEDFATDVCFQDKSLFEDGSSVPSNDDNPPSSLDIQRMTDSDNMVCCTGEARDVSATGIINAMSDTQEETGNLTLKEKTGDSSSYSNHICEKQVTRESSKEIERYLKFASLEVFSRLAEDKSFMDAHIQNLTPENSFHQPVKFGWWHAKLSPDLSDTICKHQDGVEWATKSTRFDLCGAVEVASVECQEAKFKSSVERIRNHCKIHKETEVDGSSSPEMENEIISKMSQSLPSRNTSYVLQMTSNDGCQRHQWSRERLYGNVSSALPLLLHCSHRVVTTEYLPSLRVICHSERLRETAKMKRRFLHYLDSNSFTISRSNQASLADEYLLN